MFAGHREPGRHGLAARVHDKAGTGRVHDDVRRRHVAAGQARRDHPAAGARREHGREIVLGGQDDRTVRTDRLDEGALFLRDGFAGTEVFDVGDADVGDDGEVRAGQAGERGDFARVVHADLPYGRVFGERGRQDGKREADVVVEIALRAGDAETHGQHGRGEFLHARLPAAAGDAGGLEGQAIPPGARQALQGLERVLHHDDGKRERPGGIGTVEQGGRRALRGGIARVGVAVVAFAAQGEIKIPGHERAGVLGNPAHGERRIGRAQGAAAHLGDFEKRQRVHGQSSTSTRLASMARRAVATSSKGTRRSANSW